MQKIIIKHISGSKANHIEEFPLAKALSLSLGRAAGCSIRYDDRDDLVSRAHARITTSPQGDENAFVIKDLNSRNGTYINGQKVLGASGLSPGDVIQLGLDGPELQFDLDPRPENSTLAKGTGIDTAAKASVSRSTVERLLGDYQASSRKTLITWTAVITGVIALATALLVYLNQRTQEAARQIKTPTEIARVYGSAVVLIEAGWNLIHTKTGQQVYQHVVSDNNCRSCLAYLDINGRIHPWLSVEQKTHDLPIQGSQVGSGFAVTDSGFILTNRQVAAAWYNPWEVSDHTLRRVYSVRPLAAESGGALAFEVLTSQFRPLAAQDMAELRAWNPASASYLIEQGPGEIPVAQDNGPKAFEGRFNRLDITFANSKLRIPARLIRASSQHGVVLLKIDLPSPVQKIDLSSGYDAAQPGNSVTVLGYSSTPAVFQAQPQDHSGEPALPTLTVMGALIGKVIGKEAASSAGSPPGQEIYQLSPSPTDAGNNGGPVFDDHGRIIGLFAAGSPADASAGFVIPIRLGRQIMDTHSITHR